MSVVQSSRTKAPAEAADMDAGARARALRVPATATITLGRLLIVVVLVAAWQLCSGRLVPAYLISSPTAVAQRLYDLFKTGTVWPDIGITTQELVSGYVIGIVGGIVVGVVLGSSRIAAALIEPLLAALNSVPKIALAPLFLLWFGIGLGSKIAIAAMTVFFVMFYNVYMGMGTIPKGLVNTLRIMGAGRWVMVRQLILPQLTVPILAGLKAGVSFAMIGVVVGEFVAADSGLGYYVRNSTDLFDSPGVYAGIILLMLLVLIGVGLVTLLERRLLRWRR
jgi:NitT/TauT family transport system permease protein